MDEEDTRALRAQIDALTAAVAALAGAKGPARDLAVSDLGKRYAKRASKAAMYTLRAFLAAFGDRFVLSLRKVDYLQFRDERRDRKTVRGEAPAVGTLNTELACVMAMFRWGVAAELIDVNPFEGVKKLKGQRSRETELDPHEHAGAFEDASLLVRVFQTTCIETGMRNGCEVRRMEWPHIDNARSVIYVPRENTKGKTRAREVPMSDYLRDTLKGMTRVLGSPFVFANPHTKRPYSAKHLNHLSRPYLNLLPAAPGDKRAQTHDGRHSLVSRLARGGLGPMPSMRIVGHETASQHWRYLHVSDDDRGRAKALLDAQRRGPKPSPGSFTSHTLTDTHLPNVRPGTKNA